MAPDRKKKIRGATYPPKGKRASTLTNEELANLLAPLGYSKSCWSGCHFDNYKKYITNTLETVLYKNIVSVIMATFPLDTREGKIYETYLMYVKWFSEGWIYGMSINHVCGYTSHLYQCGAHESLIIEWAKRLGCIVKKECRKFDEIWTASSPYGDSAILLTCNPDGISWHYKFT